MFMSFLRRDQYPAGGKRATIRFPDLLHGMVEFGARRYSASEVNREAWADFLRTGQPAEIAISVADGTLVCSTGKRRPSSINLKPHDDFIKDYVTASISGNGAGRAIIIGTEPSDQGSSLLVAEQFVQFLLGAGIEPEARLRLYDSGADDYTTPPSYAMDVPGYDIYDGPIGDFVPVPLTPEAANEQAMGILALQHAGQQTSAAPRELPD